MPTPAYMRIEGVTQGLITKGAFTEASVGNIYVEGHEDEFLVQAASHHVNIPRDPQSGQPTGQRVHDAFTVTKIVDKSSPQIYQALTTGERLTLCRLKMYRTSISGTQEHFFNIDLEDAILVGVTFELPHCQDPGKAYLTAQEHLSFSYRKIIWTHEAAGTSASDDWRAPRK